MFNDTKSEKLPPQRALSVFTSKTRAYSRNDSRMLKSPSRNKHGRTFGASTGLRLIEGINVKAIGYDQESLGKTEGPFFNFKLQENIYSKSWEIHKKVNDFK